MHRLFQARSFARYVIKGKSKYYIHSPFVFSFINNVLHDKRAFYCYEEIEELRKKLKHSHEIISVEDFGAGAAMKKRERLVRDIVLTAVKPGKYGQLLFRIASAFNAHEILELGTSLGLTTLYLSSANDNSKVITLEGSSAIAAIAMRRFNEMDRKNIQLVEGRFEETLPKALEQTTKLDLVYFDGNHRLQPTLHYFEQCLAKSHNDSIFVFDDIYWSKEMAEAWKRIKSHEAVTLTIDLFQLGIVFFRKEMQKEHFVLYY